MVRFQVLCRSLRCLADQLEVLCRSFRCLVHQFEVLCRSLRFAVFSRTDNLVCYHDAKEWKEVT